MKSNSKRIHIVYIIAGLSVGGAEKQLYLLLSNLDQCKYMLHVLAFGSGVWEDRIKRLGISVEIIPYSYGKIFVLRSIFRYLKLFKPHIVHTIGQSANYIGRIAAIMSQIPVIIIGERTTPFIKNRLQKILEHILAPFTDYLISNSRHAADFYIVRKILPTTKVSVIYNGVDTSDMPIALENQGGCKIGYVASLRLEKNHKLLLQAMVRIDSEVSDAELHLAGNGTLKTDIITQAESLGLKSKIKLHGQVADIHKLLSQLDIYVHTSHYEGFPNAVMEAMACGLPCVVLNTSGCAELVRHQETGLVVTPDNPELLADALLKLIHWPELRYRLGRTARNHIQYEYPITRMVTETETVYSRIIENTQRIL